MADGEVDMGQDADGRQCSNEPRFEGTRHFESHYLYLAMSDGQPRILENLKNKNR
jgi:hypothetical protein